MFRKLKQQVQDLAHFDTELTKEKTIMHLLIGQLTAVLRLLQSHTIVQDTETIMSSASVRKIQTQDGRKSYQMTPDELANALPDIIANEGEKVVIPVDKSDDVPGEGHSSASGSQQAAAAEAPQERVQNPACEECGRYSINGEYYCRFCDNPIQHPNDFDACDRDHRATRDQQSFSSMLNLGWRVVSLRGFRIDPSTGGRRTNFRKRCRRALAKATGYRTIINPNKWNAQECYKQEDAIKNPKLFQYRINVDTGEEEKIPKAANGPYASIFARAQQNPAYRKSLEKQGVYTDEDIQEMDNTAHKPGSYTPMIFADRKVLFQAALKRSTDTSQGILSKTHLRIITNRDLLKTDRYMQDFAISQAEERCRRVKSSQDKIVLADLQESLSTGTTRSGEIRQHLHPKYMQVDGAALRLTPKASSVTLTPNEAYSGAGNTAAQRYENSEPHSTRLSLIHISEPTRPY